MKQGIEWNWRWGECCPSVAQELVRMDIENLNHWNGTQTMFWTPELIESEKLMHVQVVAWDLLPDIIEEYLARWKEIEAWLSQVQVSIIRNWHNPLSPAWRDYWKTAGGVMKELPRVSINKHGVRHGVNQLEQRIARLMYPSAFIPQKMKPVEVEEKVS